MTSTPTMPTSPADDLALATGRMVPTVEAGHPGNIAPLYGIRGQDGDYVVESTDANPEWTFPQSAHIADRMRKEDGQVGSVYRAITYPILNAERTLAGVRPEDPNDVPEGVDPASLVRPEVARFVANELGLDLTKRGARRRRRRQGVVFNDHLRESLLCLVFGFMPFEVTYSVDVAAPGLEDPERDQRLGTNLYAHLRRLSARMPRTLTEVLVDAEGGLAGVLQQPPATVFGPGYRQHNTAAGLTGELRIDVDRLVMYCHEREGAEWTGTSMLRTAYKHWLIKDELIRIGAQAAERNSMGVPVVTHDENTSRADALKVARDFRAGAQAGVALKLGQTLSLIGVQGSTIDTVPLVKYHDESIGRSMLAMFLNLGHDNGARALGATFVDYFLLAINAILREVEEVVTEHIIRDLVELNYGPDEPYPSLVFTDLTAEATPTAEALAALATAGLLTADRDTENDVRRRYRLPEKPAPAATETAALDDAAGSPFADIGIPALIAAGVIDEAEGRKMLKIPGNPPPAPIAALSGPSCACQAPDVAAVVWQAPGATVALSQGNSVCLSCQQPAGTKVTSIEAPAGADLLGRVAHLSELAIALTEGHRG